MSDETNKVNAGNWENEDGWSVTDILDQQLEEMEFYWELVEVYYPGTQAYYDKDYDEVVEEFGVAKAENMDLKACQARTDTKIIILETYLTYLKGDQ